MMQRRLAWIVVAIFSATLGFLVLPSASLAAPPLAPVRTQALRLQAQIDTLNTQMEVVIERYDAARMKLADDGARVASNARQLALARYDLTIARHELALQVVAMYKQQPVQFIDVVLSTKSFSELVDQVQLLGKVGQQGAGLAAQIDRQRAAIAQRQAQLVADRQQAQKLVTQASQEKNTITAALAQRQSTLAHAQAQVKRLMAQMQTQKLLAAARTATAAQATIVRAERAALAAAPSSRPSAAPRPSASASPRPTARPRPTAPPKPTPKPAPKPTPKPRPSPQPAPPGPGQATAVTIAKGYLGVPYVWGGASPSGFDCSGLVMYVFAKLGISLPHNAAMQFAVCTPVARNALAAGDLVFFGSSPATIHHVGIYVGNGTMIDAPYTGAVVRYDQLSSDFYSGGRP
jgi:cell wall-associated NlpC family hydrolase